MAAKSGRLHSSGAISVSQVNAHAGLPSTRTASLGDNHMRAFQGNRAPNTATSLGDARGRAVTWRGTLKTTAKTNPATIPRFSLTQYFHPSQMHSSYILYTTTSITEQGWGVIDNPRNMNVAFGTTRGVRFGGTGGRKNFYCDTTYYNNKSMYLRGHYSGKSTNYRIGKVNVTHLSLLDVGSGTKA